MLVSWEWLKEYTALEMDREQLEDRLAMSGLNHEGTEQVGDDFAIDLEVTSNRPDCLGHIGVAREIAVLWDQPLRVTAPAPQEGKAPVSKSTSVVVECPELCRRYTARIIRGVKIGPSPQWLQQRLKTVGIEAVNNVVDISNYVLMECGQPLHTFDFTRLSAGRIIVREARKGEKLVAIDHKTYELEPGMCVIADAAGPVALAGVMGGAATEVGPNTTDLLIEAADFAPLNVRTTARRLKLHSDSSYRFERGVDPEGIDWASRRCCELILELAGGVLECGMAEVHQAAPPREPIALRQSQIKRVLGIEVPADETRRILTALGAKLLGESSDTLQVAPPSWRRDLTREIDLIEEVARMHGYDKIPEDARVPMTASHKREGDRVLSIVRGVLTARGFDEAMTTSVSNLEWVECFRAWSDQPPLQIRPAMLRGADRLRQSLIPSLLESRRVNESFANSVIELFETAKVYLPQDAALPNEQLMLALTSGRDFFHVKGAIEQIIQALHADVPIDISPANLEMLDPVRSCRLSAGGEMFGVLGEVTPAGCKKFGLRGKTTVAEIRLSVLENAAKLIPQFAGLSTSPAISRDLNLVLDETVRWSDLETTVRASATDAAAAVGAVLEAVDFREIFRNAKKDGPGKKRLLFSVTFRADDRTLTNQQADEVREKICEACRREHGAALLAG